MFHIFIHGSYAINLVINNQAFIIYCVQGQNLKVNCFIVTNNASHDLTLPQINKLVIIHLEEIPNVKLFPSVASKLCLLPKVLQQHLLHHKVINANIKWGFKWNFFALVYSQCCYYQMLNNNIEAIRFGFHANKSVWSWRFHDSCNKKMGRGEE